MSKKKTILSAKQDRNTGHLMTSMEPEPNLETENPTDPIVTPHLEASEPQRQSEFLPKRNRVRMVATWIGCVSAVAIAAPAAWYGYQAYSSRPTTPPATVSLTPVTRGNVELSVTESGTVALGGQQTLTAPREATIDQVNIKEGDRVRKGQVLLVLRDREVQESIRDQQIEQVKFQLDFDRAGEKLAEAKAKVVEAEKRLKETQELVTGGFLSDTDLQTDKTDLAAAQSALRDEQISMQKMQIDRDNQQQKLIALQRQLQDTAVVSPIDGIVLSLNVANGAGVQTEAKLLSLGDPNQEIVQLQFIPANAEKVKVNAVAKVQMIGPAPKVFPGRVISISPLASFGDPNVPSTNNSGQATVAAKVLLDRPSNTLIPGSIVSVEVITQSRRDVIVVPPDLIQKGEGAFVWMRDEQGNAKQQPVKLGLIGLQGVEIKSGLNAGDQIVVPSPETPLSPGMKINVAN
jgi:HlyD family secretion protein